MTGSNPLPTTHSEISNNPSKNAVTSATNPERQQAEVERKLKLYGVIQAFRDGRMPDNDQCNEFLEHALTSSPIDLKKLSPDGKLLIEDFRDIIETARMMILEKNEGELLQNFLYSTTQGDVTRGKKSKSELLPVGKNEVKADSKEAAAHLRTIFTLFFTNSEARKLLNDAGLIGRDLFATGAAKVADKARPDQEQLDQVDKEAPSGEWIGPDGKKVGKNETPELQIKGPKGSEIRMNPKDDPRDAKTVDHHGNERRAGDAYDEAQQKKEEVKGAAQQKVNEQGGTGGIKEQLKGHAQDVMNSDDPKGALQSKKEQAKGAADENTPDRRELEDNDAASQARAKRDQAKDKLNQGVDKTKNFLDEQIPEERRDQFIYRMKKVIAECQEHKDWQEATDFFIQKGQNYKGHSKHIANQGADSAGAVAEDPAFQTSFIQFRTLLERFANNRSMEPVIDAVDNLYEDANNDRELADWFHGLSNYIQRVLQETGYILDDESTRDFNKIKDSGRHFFGTDGKYKPHFDALSEHTQTFFSAMGDDPLNLRLGDDVRRLVKDLLYDSEGSLTFKPKLWNDVRRVILPSIATNIGYVPIPRAEYSDDTIDLVIENLVLQGANLLPNVIDIGNQSHFSFSPYSEIEDKSHNTFTIGLSQIQCDIKDASFAFRKKKGFPKIKDAGLAHVLIGGRGISVKVTLETVQNRHDSVVRLKSSDVDIDTLRFQITNSSHDLLYKFIKSFANNIIKKAIEGGVKAAIMKAVSELDSQLVEVRNRVNEAKESDEITRTQALKDLYARKKETAKHNAEKADEKTGTFKIVTKKEDSIVGDLNERQNKDSWTKRAFKVEDAAQTGEGWKSPVFSLFDNAHPATTGKAHPSVTGSSITGASSTTGSRI